MNEKKIIKVMGYILISPTLYSLVFFFKHVAFTNYYNERLWLTGDFNSTIHIYIGLLAIAGALLIKN